MMNNHLKRDLANIEIPTELHERSKMGVKRARSEMGGKIKKYVRSRLIAGILAVSLLIPTGVFAYETLLVDEFYGSYENVKKHITNATIEGYWLINAKLTQAKGDLGQEDFEQFKELLKIITTSKLEYGNEYSHVDYSQIPAEQLSEIKGVLYDIQPFFDTLNGQRSSQEVLTAAEYEQYIDALMTYEQILAQSGVKAHKNAADELPVSLQEAFAEAEDVLMYVNDKQLWE